MANYFKLKPLDRILAEQASSTNQLKRVLNVWSLTAIGIGCIIGTGIFVLTGKVAIENAGSGILISFAICAVVCLLAALCYAEFASLIPISGSAYTYSYATLGEIIAWIIGWDLILEYGLSTAAVASGWSSYFVNLLQLIGINHFPDQWALTPFDPIPGTAEYGIINLPAVIITLLITCLLVVGVRESAKINNIMVAVKLSVAILFIVVGFFFVNPSNWSPIVPAFKADPTATITPFDFETTEMWKYVLHSLGHDFHNGFGGWSGIFMGAAVIFFAYIGFDAVSTTSEEAKNPSRDVPIAIIASLIISTILYMLMAAVFTGIVLCDGTLRLDDLGVDKGAPLAYAFKQTGNPFIATYATFFIVVGGLAGITSVLLVTLLGQSRIFFSMSRDGLLPEWTAQIHKRFHTPWKGTLITGIVVSLAAGLVPLDAISEMANIGTLFAFILVAAGVIYLRRSQPNRKATFRVPLVPWIPIVTIVACLVLMISLPVMTWIRFVVWMGLGMLVYRYYGRKHSRL